MWDQIDKIFRSRGTQGADESEALKLLKQSPVFKQLEAEQENERMTQIRQLREQLDRGRRDYEAQYLEDQAAVNAALRVQEKAEEALRDAVNATRRVEHVRLSNSLTWSSARDRMTNEIRLLAPREIEDFIFEMIAVDEKIRNGVDVEVRDGKRLFSTGVLKDQLIVSNVSACRAARTAITNAIAEARAMQLSPKPKAEIIDRLDELRRSIPDTRVFDTTIAEFPEVRELRQH